MQRIPAELEEVPKEYLKAASHAGTVETFVYDTYDAFSYRAKRQKIQKTALVYLPYRYDSAKQYIPLGVEALYQGVIWSTSQTNPLLFKLLEFIQGFCTLEQNKNEP